MFRNKTWLVVVVVVLALLFAFKRVMRAADTGKMPSAGQMAPDFTLNSQDDKPVTLSQFRGKWVVLYFYPKDMTSGCTIEAHNFQRDQSKYDAAHAVIVGVSVQDTSMHRQFCAKEGLNFKLLADTDKKVSRMYDSMMTVFPVSERNTFLINPQGKIVRVWTKVDPDVHSTAVLAELAKDGAK